MAVSERSRNPDPLLVDDAVHEINQRWGEPHGEDIDPLDQALVRETAEAVLAPLWAEVERLREVMGFYAASVNYAPQNPPGTGSPIWRDAGRRAREALDNAR